MSQRAFRIAAWIATLGVISLPIIAAMNGWLAADRWPFRQLSVHGEFQHVSLEQVRAAAAPALAPGYFAVDLERVRNSVSALPWVEQVEVRKLWPDQAEVVVIEREAVASWGTDKLLSAHGDLFDVPANTLPQGLPSLSGPDELRSQVWDFYREAQRVLEHTGLVPTGVVLSVRGAWTLPLANGGELLLGRTQAQARLQRFADVYRALSAADATRLQRGDLRYSNGFALRWSPAVDAQAPAPVNELPAPPPSPATPPTPLPEPAQT